MALMKHGKLDLWFDPQRISVVGSDGGMTSVLGLSTGILRITQPPDEFLRALGIDGQFMRLTRVGNKPVWINTRLVGWVRSHVDDDGAEPGAKTVLGVGDAEPSVIEDSQVVIDLLVTAKLSLSKMSLPDGARG